MGPPLQVGYTGRLHRSLCQDVSTLPTCLSPASPCCLSSSNTGAGTVWGCPRRDLGGENATATDAAPSDIVGTLVQVIPAILSSNGSLPMDQIGEAIGIQKEPIASPFTKPVQFAANPKVSAALAA